jgi:hypothetical protein
MSKRGSHLKLWDWLDEATQVVEQVPELVQVADGVAALEWVLDDLLTEPIALQLAVAAEALARLSNVLDRKSEEWLADWDRQTTEGISLAADWTTGLVRQSVVFDLSPLLATPGTSPKTRLRPTRPAVDSSIAAPVTVESMLAMVDQLELDQLSVQAQLACLAGEELPQHWQNEIAQVMTQHRQVGEKQITFSQLQQQTGLAAVELWLGLLLGGYQLEAILPQQRHTLDAAQRFYQMEIRVTIA